jgi:hypothetical protein
VLGLPVCVQCLQAVCVVHSSEFVRIFVADRCRFFYGSLYASTGWVINIAAYHDHAFMTVLFAHLSSRRIFTWYPRISSGTAPCTLF